VLEVLEVLEVAARYAARGGPLRGYGGPLRGSRRAATRLEAGRYAAMAGGPLRVAAAPKPYPSKAILRWKLFTLHITKVTMD